MSENTPDQDEIKNVEVSATQVDKKPSAKKTSKKGLIISLTSLVVVIILLVVATFVKFGNQTVLARTLDAVGQHKLALGADYFGTKGFSSTQANILNLDPSNPKDCENIWTSISTTPIKDLGKIVGADTVSKQSSTVKYQIKPVANDYQDKFSFEGYISSGINTKDNLIGVSFDSAVITDFDAIKKIIEQGGASSASFPDYGPSVLSGKAKIVTDTKNVYTNLPELQFKTKNFNVGGGLTNWYKTDAVNATQADKDKYNKVVAKFTENKLSDALSDETGKAIFAYLCSGVQSYTVESPTTVTFGDGQYSKTKDVRPVTLTLKPDFYTNYLKNIPNIIEKISQDQKLKPFLKNNYDNIVEIAKTDGSTSYPTKEEFNKSVDEMFKDFDKNKVTEEINKTISEMDKNVKLVASPIKSYIALDTLKPYASTLELKVVPQDQLLSSINNPEGVKVLKDGIVFRLTEYDIKLGDQADNITIPANAKNISELPADFGQSPIGKKVEEEFNKPSTSPAYLDQTAPTNPNSMDGSMMFDPNTNTPLPVPGDIPTNVPNQDDASGF